jgi:Zn-dependent M28 family amino/carboxypeptidase
VNDNGSGSSSVLELAVQMSRLGITPKNKVNACGTLDRNPGDSSPDASIIIAGYVCLVGSGGTGSAGFAPLR